MIKRDNNCVSVSSSTPAGESICFKYWLTAKGVLACPDMTKAVYAVNVKRQHTWKQARVLGLRLRTSIELNKNMFCRVSIKIDGH